MKIACVLVTHLRMKAELRRHAHLRDRPAVIVDGSQSRPLVLDSTPEASGVTVGIALEDALSHRADTIVLEADEPYYQKVFDQLIEALLQISDRVEKAGLGCAYVQIDGLELLYGGEERLVALLRQAVHDDLSPRIGIAEAKFPAFVSALQGRGAPTASGPDSTAAFLKPLSVDLLPISSEDKGLLHDFGIHTMEQVGSLSIGVLQAQFGLGYLVQHGLQSGWAIGQPQQVGVICSRFLSGLLPGLHHLDAAIQGLQLSRGHRQEAHDHEPRQTDNMSGHGPFGKSRRSHHDFRFENGPIAAH